MQDQESNELGARSTGGEPAVVAGEPHPERSKLDSVRRSPDSSSAASEVRDLRIEERLIASLTPRRRNPRTHSEKQIRQIADSIETFGFTNPVLIDSKGTVIAGHGRVRAAKLLGMQAVPTLALEHLTEAQIRAYVIADNKLAENAGWDRDLLAIELQELAELDLGFDLEVIGFETAEIDLLIGDAASSEAPDSADEIAEIDPEAPVVSRRGDLWSIGPHRLLCGDATDTAAYARLVENRKAQMVFVDPPYNVPIEGHVSGLGRAKHAEFAMASGEMSEAEFVAFLETALGRHAASSADGAIHFVCMDWRHTGELLAAGRRVYSELKNVCVWVKTNAGMGSLYRSQHELVFVFKVGGAPHVNNVELGRFGRTRTNVWRYAGVNSFGAGRAEALSMHPTVKPVRLVADAILDCSRRGAIVLDGFAGSGTTLLAAERTGRIGYGLEIEPRYVDVAIRRLAEHAGLEAVHVESGMTFAEVAAERARACEPVGAAFSDAQQELREEPVR
jgi:DNA modification methylase